MAATTLASLLGLALATLPNVTPAQQTGEHLKPTHDAERGEAETDNGVSARVLVGGPLVGEGEALYGVGVAYERDVAHGAIAIELAGEVFVTHEESVLVAELVVEKPIELTHHVALYVGGGPTLLARLEKDQPLRPGFGALTLVGVEWEFIDRWELFLELDTAFLYVDAPVVESDVGAGVMFRF